MLQVMATSHQGQRNSNEKRKLFRRHPVKLLNLGLILYLALGALLFDLLGEFRATSRNGNDKVPKRAVDLRELRVKSVGRMWNITNQLNILYESNWTQLVLEELIEFERQFIDSLAAEGEQYLTDDLGGEEWEEEEGEEKDREQYKKGDENSRSKRRTRSIKKSLIHSLATITTIGSPLASLKSDTGKLATVLYGALGIPLLFCTVARTGHQLAQSAANSLLIVRHYCVALPLHYLCCACSPFQWLRWVSWCCCCCCCSYLCCKSADRNKRKCCDTSRAPKLRLVQSARMRRSKAAATTGRRSQSQAAAYVIAGNAAQLANGDLLFDQQVNRGDNNFGGLQKSVRFPTQQQQQKLQAPGDLNRSSLQQEVAQQLERAELEGEDCSFRSPGLFVTSLAILGLYLALGAFIYSRSQNTSIMDAVFVCYDMLSVSHLPSSFGLEPTYKTGAGKIANLYHSLKANKSSSKKVENATGEQRPLESSGAEWLAWQTLYLVCGLNLVSMCGQFAKLWLADAELDEQLAEEILDSAPLCNGFDPAFAMAPQTSNNLVAQFATSQMPSKSESQYMLPAVETQLVPGAPSVAMQPQQQQIDLAELFVVSQQTSPAEIQYQSSHHHHNHHHGNHQPQHNSDVSFASDTERNSLCQHHQAGASAPSVVPTGSTGAIYGQLTGCGRNHQLALAYPRAGGCQHEDGQEEDDYEMDRMLKTCIGNSNQRSSSSSIHLSHSNAYLSSSAATSTKDAFGQPSQYVQQPGSGSSARSSTLGRQLRLAIEPNGCEQDSSLNTFDTTTNSNTISSVSSRTIKLPQHVHIQRGIGFVLDGNTTDNEDNKL